MGRFRKKPVEIEAWQFTLMKDAATQPDWLKAAFLDGAVFYQGGADPYLTIETLEGTHRASLGDWIIQGVKGELYPCKPEIFAATYDVVEG
ncbi:MAG: hypothetical protein J0I54_17815 [Bosea sp.]|uniref:hypothetical protein n=1 Tax=unclassified Bosea (in: a-proteobacteria) TaxID=2653178 RepID=UPI0009683187|nr:MULTISPECIES: hypothetical protein [unclassified Bosea (in: a-proteobacteria)]MBN9458491.1 hypothetical protein [Bosea sp. (in: a-proteobacteria)]OJV06807.1 MAG: hypothetical protein BGO20_00130 [Bosea sp. 67-29]